MTRSDIEYWTNRAAVMQARAAQSADTMRTYREFALRDGDAKDLATACLYMETARIDASLARVALFAVIDARGEELT